jgi:hypothetical protein
MPLQKMLMSDSSGLQRTLSVRELCARFTDKVPTRSGDKHPNIEESRGSTSHEGFWQARMSSVTSPAIRQGALNCEDKSGGKSSQCSKTSDMSACTDHST